MAHIHSNSNKKVSKNILHESGLNNERMVDLLDVKWNQM